MRETQPGEEILIEVTEAVRKAKEVFLALHEQDTVKEVRMAEAELGRDGTTWQVTLSYFDDDVSGISKHKLLELDAETGIVRSVKVRTL